MNHLETVLILIQLLYLCNCEEESEHKDAKRYNNTIETSLPLPLRKKTPARLRRKDDVDSCYWGFEECGHCEVCVENFCLPYVVEAIFKKGNESEYCIVRDLCEEGSIECADGTCRPSYGSYFCECEQKYNYGQRCEMVMKDWKHAPVRNIHVIYAPAMRAVGSHNTYKESESIMVSWEANSALIDSFTLEYSVLEPEFSDSRTFTDSQLDPDPVGTCANIIQDVETCRSYFGHETRYSIVFPVRFPFIPDKETQGRVKTVHIKNPKKADLIGYEIWFNISINVRSYSSTSTHPVFVYYEKVDSYKKDCFPVKIQPTSCVDRWSVFSTAGAQSGYKKSFKEIKTISATTKAKRTHSRCEFFSKFLYKKNKPNLDLESKEYTSTAVFESLTFKSFTTDIGVYRVEIESSWIHDPELVNFAVCFFEVNREPLKAVIQGGDSRTVYAKEDLVMDATGSEDPNNPPGMQSNLLFTWSCSQVDKVCKVHKTKARQYVIKAPLPTGVVYDFELVVSAFNQSKVRANQQITTTADRFASFSIVCRKNCGDEKGSNPKKSIYLETIVKGKEYLEDDEFRWSYNYSDEITKNNSDAKLPPIEAIMAKIPVWNICIILPEYLNEGKYSFTALRIKTQGTARYSITIGASPKVLNKCYVNNNKMLRFNEYPDTSYLADLPESILQPSYEVQCEVFPVSVSYIFYLSDGDQDNLPIYLLDTVDAKAKNLLNYETKESNQNIMKVKFYYQSGHYSIVDVFGKLQPSTVKIDSDYEDTWETVDFVLYWAKQRVHEMKAKPVQSDLLGYLNTLLSLANNNTMNAGLSDAFVNAFYIPFVELSQFGNYFEVMSSLSVLTRFMQTLGVPPLRLQVSINDELAIKIALQLYAMVRLFEQYEEFYQSDKMISTDEFVQMSKSFFDCLRLLFNSLFEAKNMKDTYLSMKKVKNIPDVFQKSNWSDEIIDRSKRDVFNTHNKKRRSDQYEKLKRTTQVLAISLKSYMNALAKRILPMENYDHQYGLTFYKGKFVVSVMADNPAYFDSLQKLPPNATYSFINITNALATELHQLSPYIKVKMVFLEKNPFWWDMDESEISSQVLYAEMMQREKDDSWSLVYSTKSDLDVHLSLNERKNTSVQGFALLPLPGAEELERESSVAVYRVWPPLFGGGGTLFVRFVGLSQSDSLRVALTDSFHPDFNYMNTYAQTVNVEHNEVSLTYDIKGKNSFLFIGVIPGPLFKPKDPLTDDLPFTFEAYIVRCLMRRHSMWLAKYCRVNTECSLDESRIHCLCKNFNGMIAAAVIAPLTEHMEFIPLQFKRGVEINYTPLAAVIVLLSSFVVFLIWAFYRDRSNVSKRHVIVLEDNFPGEEWPYLVGVYTGTRPWSGTDANIGIQLFGLLADSRTHILRSSERQTHSSYSDDWFLIFSPKRLGKITKMHIWMDYTEKGADWYCRKILVYDFSSKEKYLFRLSCWFYISLYSELLNVYMAPEASNKKSTKHLLGDNFASYFQELHYAISTIHHHPRSLMSGAEIVATFWTTVVSSALLLLLFYKYDYSGTEDYFYFHFTKTDLLVALLGHIPSIPVSILIKIMFKSKVVTKDSNTWKSISKKIKKLENSYTENELTENRKKAMDRKNKHQRKASKTHSEVYKSRKEAPYQHPIMIESTEHFKVNKGRNYTTWIFVIIAMLGMCVGIVVEGLSMSEIKSHIWLCVCFMAMFIGLFISNTLRVVVDVLIATFISKKQFDEPVIVCDPTRGMRMDKMGDKEHLDKILNMRSKPEYYPPKPEQIEDIRTQMKSKILLTSLLELFKIFFIYFLVIFGAMNSWGTQDFYQKHHLTSILTEAKLDRGSSVNSGGSLKHIQDLDSLKMYFQSTLSSMYSVTEWYNNMDLTFKGDKFPETGWLMDFTSRMIGVVQIRQKLVKTEDCINPLYKEKFVPVNCCPLLTIKNEDRQKYTVGWSPENEIIESDSESQWHFTQPDTPMMSFYSEDGRYFSDSGYFLNLGRTKEETTTILWKMDEANWFSHRAEVIFVESCIYNVNINKISVITMSLELGHSYGIFKHLGIINVEVTTEMFDFDFAFWGFLAVVLGILIGYIAFMIFEYGVNFFYSFWNVIDFFIMIFFCLCYAYGLTNKFHTKTILDKLNTGNEKFSSYGWLEYHNEYYYFLYIVLIVLSTLKLFKYFRNTLQIDPILRTLSSAAFYLSRVTLICLPLLYFQFYICDSLLFNTQQPSNRLPLVNKLGLKNYAKQYVFPDNKFVPYLYCQFCTLLITLFSLLIVHHYKISKNSVFFPTYNVDIIEFCKESWRGRSSGKKIRLRSGAEKESWKTGGRMSVPDLAATEKLPIKNQARSENCWKKERSRYRQNRPDMNALYKNMDTKLDRIKEALIFLNDNFEDEELDELF